MLGVVSRIKNEGLKVGGEGSSHGGKFGLNFGDYGLLCVVLWVTLALDNNRWEMRVVCANYNDDGVWA